MHPTLARFLDVGKALALLERQSTGTQDDPDDAAFLRAAQADAGLSGSLAAARGSEHPGPDAQQALVVLAVRAALERLADDAELGPLVRDASAALSKEGASADEITQMMGTVLLEEGFADDGDPQAFDRPFVRETLLTLPALARLDSEQVDGLLEGFVATQDAAARPLALRAADTFLSEAWGEGLQPLTSEHAELAVETLWYESSGDDGQKLVAALGACLVYLEQAGVIGPARRTRLEAACARSLAMLIEGDAFDEDAPLGGTAAGSDGDEEEDGGEAPTDGSGPDEGALN